MEKQFINVHDNHLGQINTASGKVIDFNHPTADMISAVDIANALSKIARFGGHTNSFWSVGQHSLLVAALAPEELKLEALCHDMSEAYLGDVVKPLKNILGETYARLERNFMAVIVQKFWLSWPKLDAIKPLDMEALELEHEAFLKNNVAANDKIFLEIGRESGQTPFGPFQTRELFLDRLTKYQRGNELEAQSILPNNIPQL